MIPDWFLKFLHDQPTVAFFNLEHTSISYRHWPSDNKPGLIFVHGHSAHARWWDFIAPAFKDSHNVAAIDLSGHGDSGHRPSYSARLFAREIISCIKTTNMKSATIVGHSFGGVIARITAYLYPNQISAIVLADSYISTQQAPRRQPTIHRGKTRYYPNLSESVKRFRLRPPQPRPKDFIFNYIAEHSFEDTVKGYRFKFDPTIFSKMSEEEELPVAKEMIHALKQPVGLIYGEQSRFFLPALLANLRELILPDLSFGIPDAHHHVFLDQPEKFIDTLMTLLSMISIEEE